MICAKIDCKNKAKHHICFTAYAFGQPKSDRTKAKGSFNFAVCDSHKTELTLADLVTQGVWEGIQQRLLSNGKALLDRNTVELVYEKI